MGRRCEEILMQEPGHLFSQVRDILVEASPPIRFRHEGFQPCGVLNQIRACHKRCLGHAQALVGSWLHLLFRRRHALHHDLLMQKLLAMLHAVRGGCHQGDDRQIGQSGRQEKVGVCRPSSENQMACTATRIQELLQEFSVEHHRICERPHICPLCLTKLAFTWRGHAANPSRTSLFKFFSVITLAPSNWCHLYSLPPRPMSISLFCAFSIPIRPACG